VRSGGGGETDQTSKKNPTADTDTLGAWFTAGGRPSHHRAERYCGLSVYEI